MLLLRSHLLRTLYRTERSLKNFLHKLLSPLIKLGLEVNMHHACYRDIRIVPDKMLDDEKSRQNSSGMDSLTSAQRRKPPFHLSWSATLSTWFSASDTIEGAQSATYHPYRAHAGRIMAAIDVPNSE